MVDETYGSGLADHLLRVAVVCVIFFSLPWVGLLDLDLGLDLDRVWIMVGNDIECTLPERVSVSRSI